VKIPVRLLNKKPNKMDTGSQHTTQIIRHLFCVEIILTGTQVWCSQNFHSSQNQWRLSILKVSGVNRNQTLTAGSTQTLYRWWTVGNTYTNSM